MPGSLIPFRFINAWFSNPKCEQIIKEVWENGSGYRWAGVRIMQKLREVKEKLKIWNSSDFGNIVIKMNDLKRKLHQFDLLAEQRSLNGGEMLDRENCRQEFWSLEKTNES